MADDCPRGPNGERCAWRKNHHWSYHRAWTESGWVVWTDSDAAEAGDDAQQKGLEG